MKRAAWIIGGGAVLAAALVYAQLGRPNADVLTRNPNGQALVQTYQAIQNDYLEKLTPEQLNKVLEGGISGMLGALGSEFNSYGSPEDAKNDEEMRRGEFFGIGATLGPGADNKGAQILQLIRGLPAFNAGIQVGDFISEVNGEDVSNLSVSQVRNKIVGQRGTKVTVGVKRQGSNVTLKFDMIRERVEIVSVTSGMIPGNIGYVSLETFISDKVNDQLQAAINGLKARGATKLIFDLRDNGGGQLQQACLVAQNFIRSGPLVFQRTRDRTTEYCRGENSAIWNGPLVVLINRNSASEIVSGAVQDTKRGKVIGETSFGKGVGQYVRPMVNGGELVLVTFEWLTPNKRGINEKGVEPDIKLRDSRFESPVAFEGAGAKPGETVTLSIGGKTYSTKADAEGKYTFAAPRSAPPALPAERGQAMLDLDRDAILKRAVEELR
ncbi:MAG: S41 family peptidase [Meiothermus sp.]|nr:S41 family peptidase [Meiothermus sp.]